MFKIKKIRLQDYCGYRDVEFDFTDKNGKPKQLITFFGPNGCGKSSILEAVSILSRAHTFYGRDTRYLFRKITYNPEYDPIYTEYKEQYVQGLEQKLIDGKILSREYAEKIQAELNKYNMTLTGIFETNEGDKEVVITTDGVKKNELPFQQNRLDYSYYIDADAPDNMRKFQLHKEMESRFIDLAKMIYEYDCYLEKEVEDRNELFYTDFVINKYGTLVHFKRFSDGEKKIATLLRGLCNPIYMDEQDIIIIDNICMHIYMARHARLIDKLIQLFPDKQFFITTHSAVLVGVQDEKLGINIKGYINEKSLYDVESYKKKEQLVAVGDKNLR